MIGVACGLTAVAADNTDWLGDRSSSDSSASRSADQFFSRGGVTASPGTSLTDPISTSAKQGADDPFGDDPQMQTPGQRSGRSPIVNADYNKAKATGPSNKGSLIHAEYHRRSDDSERRSIRQVGVKGASPFDEFDTEAASPSRTAAHARNAGGVMRVGAHKPVAAVPGGLDASQAPAVAVQWVKKSPICVGQECACDLIVKNAGKVAAKDVTVDAYFPSTVRLTHAEPMPADNQDHVTWSMPALGAGEERVIHVKMIPSKRGELATTALVRFSEAASTLFVVEEPLLHLALRGPKELMVGDPATQTITISNPGTGTAHNVSIEARITKGLEHPRGNKLQIEVGSLNPGESRDVRLPLVAIAGGVQSISIHASSGTELRQELDTKFNVISPSLKVTLEGPALRYVGRNAHYQVTVINDGGAASSNVRVTHKLPEGFRFIRADKGGEFDEAARTVSWFLGRLEVRESAHLKVDVATTEIGTHLHTVSAVSEQGARSEAKLETVVDGTASLQVEIIDQNDPVEVGVETAYEIHVRNDGSKAAENVGIWCQLPAAVEMLRMVGATPGVAEKSVLKFQPIPTLEPGKTAIYRVFVRGKSEGNHRCRVRLTADSIKEPLVEDHMTKFYAD